MGSEGACKLRTASGPVEAAPRGPTLDLIFLAPLCSRRDPRARLFHIKRTCLLLTLNDTNFLRLSFIFRSGSNYFYSINYVIIFKLTPLLHPYLLVAYLVYLSKCVLSGERINKFTVSWVRPCCVAAFYRPRPPPQMIKKNSQTILENTFLAVAHLRNLLGAISRLLPHCLPTWTWLVNVCEYIMRPTLCKPRRATHISAGCCVVKFLLIHISARMLRVRSGRREARGACTASTFHFFKSRLVQCHLRRVQLTS
jgi:hypothetical protein